MLRSMFAGVSGLRAHQTMMDVIANNIANVNTVGYKSNQVVFEDLLSQVLRSAGAAQNGTGGTNPAQIGLGVKLGGITTSFAQGASQLTGRATDLSILGDGFFITENGGEQRYTRLGNFSFDSDGALVAPDGGVAQGWLAQGGVIDSNAPITGLRMPLGQVRPPTQTSTLRLGGNLPADAADGTAVTTSIKVYDSQGTAIPINFTFTKTGADEWLVTARTPDPDPSNPPIDLYTTTVGSVTTAGVTLTFDNATGLPSGPLPDIDGTAIPGAWNGTSPTVSVGLGAAGDPDSLAQFSGSSSIAALSQDGTPLGFLRSFAIGDSGVVTGLFSNGTTQVLGQIALATFNNPAGLEKAGDSGYRATVNSGLPQVGVPGSGGHGTLSSGTLEMSNVDLAQEFTNLIIAQRGFQANSRVITTSDQLLEDLVNLKR